MENERQRQYKNQVIQQLGVLMSQNILKSSSGAANPQTAKSSSGADNPQTAKSTSKPTAGRKGRKRERQEFTDEETGVKVKQELWTVNVIKNEEDAPINISSEEGEMVEVVPPVKTYAQIKQERAFDEGAGPSHDQPPPDPDVDMNEYFEDDENKPTVQWFPPEYYTQAKAAKQPKKGNKKARTEFAKNMKERPWSTDEDEMDTTEVMAPSASIPKVTGSDKKQRPCWLRLRRKWLLRNFLKHFIASSNIRFKGTTYASLCHHPTSNWDAHPLCWECYWDFDLPLCGLTLNIDCPHCRIMGVKAKQARARKLRAMQGPNRDSFRRQYSNKTGLPANIYTQIDADQWMEAKDIIQMPNPDWLRDGQPVGSCFPRRLVAPGQSVKDAVAANPKWREGNYSSVTNNPTRKRSRKLTVCMFPDV